MRGIGVAVRVSRLNVGPQRLKLLLVLDAEMLLFINDNKAQVLEPDLLTQDGVGADDDLEGTVLQARAGLGGVLGRHHARQVPHGDGPGRRTAR